MRAIAALPFAAALAGCAGAVGSSAPPAQNFFEFKEPTPSQNIMPAAYRAEIAAHLRATLKDHTSVRDAMVGPVELKRMPLGYRYAACVRFNAKNSYGGYTGLTEHLAIFADGRIVSVYDALIADCQGTVYQPFTEVAKFR
jgi:hypothetical protein